MRQLAFNAGNPIKTSVYSGFRGVDLSTDPLLVDKSRSPWAPNLISDTGGMPEKRPGWRTLFTLNGRINGLFWAVIGGTTHLLIHAGTAIYRAASPPVQLLSGVCDHKSCAVFMGGKLYLFTGGDYLCYDGTAVAPVVGKIPEIVIGRGPTGGGGTALDAINLIQPKWTEGFLGTAGAVEYQLSYGDLDATAVTASVMAADGTWASKAEATDFTVNRVTGKITFLTAPGVSPVAGRDNVKITASKLRAGYADWVKKATLAAVYNDSTLFAAGAKKGMDVQSGFSDPTYWPDLGYDQVGTDETDIMGYLPLGGYLAVIKEDNDQDATVFLRSVTTGANGEAVTIRRPCITGTGMIARGAVGTLRGDALFLSRQGIFAITSNIVTSEKMVQNRSYFIDLALTKEENLSAACVVEWEGYFLVCVNGRCYILDGKQNKTYKQQTSDYVYECYHWDHIPAICLSQRGGALYFGTADGRVCRFNNDLPGMSRYSDDGAAIAASWSTKADDDGDFMRIKQLARRGSGVLIKPYTHSSARVLVETESDFGVAAASARMDVFDFEDLDFEKFSFDTDDKAQIVPLSAGARRYQTLQFTIANNQKDEGFGVFGITKRYTLGGYAK